MFGLRTPPPQRRPTIKWHSRTVRFVPCEGSFRQFARANHGLFPMLGLRLVGVPSAPWSYPAAMSLSAALAFVYRRLSGIINLGGTADFFQRCAKSPRLTTLPLMPPKLTILARPMLSPGEISPRQAMAFQAQQNRTTVGLAAPQGAG